MVQNFSIADFIQSSTWTVDDNMNLLSGPTTDTDNKSVTFSGLPGGSVINDAVLTATIGGTNYQLRLLDGTFFSGTRNITAKVSVGGTASFEFRFKGSGSTSLGAGTHTANLQYSSVRIAVDYTPPTSAFTLDKTVCKAGTPIRATIVPAIAGVTHKLVYAMTGVTTVTSAMIPAGTNVYDNSPPLSWQNAMPNDKSRVATVTLETYSGGSKVGETARTFTLYVSDDAYPTITGFAAARIAGFSDASIPGYVQGFSKANFLSAAAGAYSATITEYKVTLGAWSVTGADVTSAIFQETGTFTATLEVTDSRGRKKTAAVNIVVLAYTPTALNTPVVYRSDAAGARAAMGTYIYVKSGVAVSSLGGINTYTLTARIYRKGTTAPVWTDPSVITLTADQQSVTGSRAISYSYVVDIRIADKLSTYVYSTVVSSSSVAFSLKAGGLGAAFGKFAELDDTLEIAWTKGLLGGNPLAAYRIGSIFFSFETESPATLFPGTTWEKLAAGRFLVSAGAGYTAGDTGGASSHEHAVSGSARLHYSTSSTAIYAKRVQYQPSWTNNFKLTGGANNVGDTALTNSTYGTEVVGTAESAAGNSLPPWIGVNIWRRTA